MTSTLLAFLLRTSTNCFTSPALCGNVPAAFICPNWGHAQAQLLSNRRVPSVPAVHAAPPIGAPPPGAELHLLLSFTTQRGTALYGGKLRHMVTRKSSSRLLIHIPEIKILYVFIYLSLNFISTTWCVQVESETTWSKFSEQKESAQPHHSSEHTAKPVAFAIIQYLTVGVHVYICTAAQHDTGD